MSLALCAIQAMGRGTVGLCVNGGAAMVFNLGGEVCANIDKNGFFFSATDAKPVENKHTPDWSDGSYGMGGGGGIRIEVSDAVDKDSLSGPFSFLEASAGPGQAAEAWGKGAHGEDVKVLGVGGSVGIPTVSGGVSHTAVGGYQFHWCGWWICRH
jgi:hypothetical protein